ncbi:GNAT family N-acetyltransferase [Caproicibacter sp.]|uniref:GNAT family N-acetyltransferase n=1 Tax=Caproicibacter sp. TaxID=2814884 RepID=UPI003988FB7C
MIDLLVRLYEIEENLEEELRLQKEGIRVFRLLATDIGKAVEFARSFSEGWANECMAAGTNHPPTCFVAVREKQIVGFACYDATAKDFFGPTGVLKSERGKGVGAVLLKKCLCAMRAQGYVYAVIGGVGDALPFYEKAVGATSIERSSPGVYSTLIGFSS